MGYRSDVRIVTSKKGFKVLDDYVKKYLREHDKNRNWNLLKRPDIKKKHHIQHWLELPKMV